MTSNPIRRKQQSQKTRDLSSIPHTNLESWNDCPPMPGTKQQKKIGTQEPWLLAPRAATNSRLKDENYFENQGQRPRAYICSRLLTWVCHGPSQSESNFINTVIKQKGNYFKYWKKCQGHTWILWVSHFIWHSADRWLQGNLFWNNMHDVTNLKAKPPLHR